MLKIDNFSCLYYYILYLPVFEAVIQGCSYKNLLQKFWEIIKDKLEFDEIPWKNTRVEVMH